MLIGIVGKPNVGKSTFFKALTLSDVLIANYPFATVEPNKGFAYVKVKCVDEEFGVQCEPRYGYCINHWRFVPVEVIDVAGLVPGASEGKGLGNKFLDDLRQADALIHVVDIAGSTNENGEPVEPGSYDPLKDIVFLEDEIDKWIFGNVKKDWQKFVRTTQSRNIKLAEAFYEKLSGLAIKLDHIEKVLNEFPEDIKQWNDEFLFNFLRNLRRIAKPIVIAANKIDLPYAKENLKRLKETYKDLITIPVSAESELALKEANRNGIIKYIPGESNFEILNANEKQQKALQMIKEKVLQEYHSTGVQDVIDTIVFNVLNYIAVFPGGVNKLADSEGRILPDCFLMPPGSTALDFAATIHTDLAKNFIKAIDVRTKKPLGKDYLLKHRDVIEIITKK